jgi:hypothetical protein
LKQPFVLCGTGLGPDLHVNPNFRPRRFRNLRSIENHALQIVAEPPLGLVQCPPRRQLRRLEVVIRSVNQGNRL